MDSRIIKSKNHLLTYITAIVFTASLSGCLGGGGSSSNDNNTAEAPAPIQDDLTPSPVVPPIEEEVVQEDPVDIPPIEEPVDQEPPEPVVMNDPDIMLLWDKPLARNSGDLLGDTDLYGYIIYYEAENREEQGMIIVGDPELTEIALSDLPEDNYSFNITTVDIFGLQSNTSPTVSKQTINDGLEDTPVPITEQIDQPDLQDLAAEITATTNIPESVINEIFSSSELLNYTIGYIPSSSS